MALTGTEITLVIDRMGGLGEGCGLWEGRKVFIPYTLAGERVRAVITQETKEFLRARLVKVEEASAERGEAFCPHFGTCGGCSFQHLSAENYSGFKRRTLEEALRKAGYANVVPEPLVEIGQGGRRRVEWSVTEENEEVKLGFIEARSHTIVDISECRVLITQLQQLIHPLRAALKKLFLGRRVESVQALYMGAMLDVGIVLKEEYEPIFEASFLALGNALGASRLAILCPKHGAKVLMEKRPITRKVDAMTIEIPPFSFLQAVEAGEQRMMSEVALGMRGCPRVADLFCGIGTFSIPLTLHANVTAYEIVGWMADAVQQAAKTHDLRKLRAEKRDLFQMPLSVHELDVFDGVVINPPREGAKAQCEELARSNVKKIVMLSCNPATFARDARILNEGGYQLIRAVGIDQFAYSPHLEIVAHFQK